MRERRGADEHCGDVCGMFTHIIVQQIYLVPCDAMDAQPQKKKSCRMAAVAVVTTEGSFQMIVLS